MNKKKFLLILFFFTLQCTEIVKGGKKMKVEKVIQGTYNLFVYHQSRLYWVGNLTLANEDFQFKFQNKYEVPSSAKKNIPTFYFLKHQKGKYIVQYSNTKIKDELINKTNSHIGTISFIFKSKLEQEKLYFFNNKKNKNISIITSKDFQMFILNKHWDTEKMTTDQVKEKADRKAATYLMKYNKTKEAKNLGGPFLLKDYKYQIKELIYSEKPSYYVYYVYTFPQKATTLFSGGPAHFTVIINKKTGASQIMHGE